MGMLLAACAQPTPQTIIQTVEVPKEVIKTVEVPKEVIKTVEVEHRPRLPAAGESLPRNETLYFNGQQWGPVKCWNPYSSDCNNALAIGEAG